MSVTREFYQACADECAAEAAAATLPNVRERALRSEAAWRAMAARQDRIARSRETAEAERLDAAPAKSPRRPRRRLTAPRNPPNGARFRQSPTDLARMS
jgi:hypothetical protein